MKPAEKKEPTSALKATALAVKRGERTYAELDDKTRGEVRSFLKTATTRDLRKLIEADRVERAPHRSHQRAANIRGF